MTHFDLAVIGTGSGNSILDDRFTDRRTALIERGTFGGTCLNVGCIPTKMYVYPADLARYAALEAPRLGVDTRLEGVRWREIRDRIFGRIDPIAQDGRDYRRNRQDHITVFEGTARFTAERALTVTPNDGGPAAEITADQVVVASGSRAMVPPIPGLGDGPDEVRPHTSDTIMRLEEVPPRLAIIGGGVIASEFAHVFSAFGSRVSIVARSATLLRQLDHEVSQRFTDLARASWDVHAVSQVTRVERHAGAIRLHVQGPDGDETIDADVVLVATGRVPNSDLVDAGAGGIEVDDDGVIVVDEQMRTSVPGVWALGDAASHHQLKHVANFQARIVQHNLLHPGSPMTDDRPFVPSAVFTYPQIAEVGMTEQQARESEADVVVATQRYADVAYGWAMEDTSGFAKVVADRRTGLLLGASVLGAQASTLIQPLIQAMSLGQTVEQMARGQYWVHPALTEVVENALLGLDLTRT